VKEALAFVNDNPDELLPLELAAHLHYFIAWIHPFDDGNGRIARLLMNLVLTRNKYPLAIVKKVDRKKYLDCLDAVTAKGDFQPFLIFIARCVEQSLDIHLDAIEDHQKTNCGRCPTSQLIRRIRPSTLVYMPAGAFLMRSRKAGFGIAGKKQSPPTWKSMAKNDRGLYNEKYSDTIENPPQ
jgi:hypothetical protein